MYKYYLLLEINFKALRDLPQVMLQLRRDADLWQAQDPREDIYSDRRLDVSRRPHLPLFCTTCSNQTNCEFYTIKLSIENPITGLEYKLRDQRASMSGSQTRDLGTVEQTHR